MRFGLVLTLCLACHALAWAQAGARIVLRVSDARGLPVHPVHATISERGRTVTAAAGRLEFAELAAGTYGISIRAAGYADKDTTVDLSAGETLEVWLSVDRLYELPEVDVTSARPSGGIRRYERAEIAASGATDLAEFLRNDAGLEVRDDGTNGAAGARIGGSNSNEVVVLLDGQRMNRIGSGESDLRLISLQDVERIEISRGSRVETGSEGIGGVISVRTVAAGGDARSAANAEFGQTMTRLRAQHGGEWRRIAGRFGYQREYGPGDYRYRVAAEDGSGERAPDVGREFRRRNNDLQRDIFTGKLQSNDGGKGRWELSGALDMSDRGMPGYLAPNLTPEARQQSRGWRLNQLSAYPLGGVHLETRVSLRDDRQEFTDPAAPFVKYSNEHGMVHEAEAGASGVLSPLRWRGGVQVGQERLESSQLATGTASRSRLAGWAELSGNRKAGRLISFTPQVGVRSERVGATMMTSPKVGLGAAAGEFATLDVRWGRSFRTPDFYSLFWAEDLVAAGNPDLVAEQSEEWVGSADGIIRPLCGLQWSALASDQRIEQMIVWRQGFDGRWKPVNLAAATVRTLGVSVEQAICANWFRWQGGFDWTEARNGSGERTTDGKYLTFRAPRTARLALQSGWRGANVAVGYRWVDRRPATESNSKWLSEYELVDARLSYSWHVRRTALRATVGAENLLEEDYRIVRFAPMPLREVYMELSITELAGDRR